MLEDILMILLSFHLFIISNKLEKVVFESKFVVNLIVCNGS